MHHHYKKGVFGMAKKGWGKFVAFAAVTGAVAAGVSYVLQYKTYHRELEKDFREFEDGGEDRTDEDGTDRTIDTRSLDRNYISFLQQGRIQGGCQRYGPGNEECP